jgi:predicted RNase H-like HicB family nuclease
MRFPAVIHKDKDSDYGVTVPDLPGCFSVGDTMDDALTNTIEAIECHIEGMLIDNEPVPPVRTIEYHSKDRRFSGGTWALVEVDLSKLSGKARRVNITLPERLLAQIDSFAIRSGETRSGFLAHAAMEYVITHAGGGSEQSADEQITAATPNKEREGSTGESVPGYS